MRPTARQQLENIENAMVEDIMALTPEKVIAEAVEELGSMEAVEAEVQRITDVILSALPSPDYSRRPWIKVVSVD